MMNGIVTTDREIVIELDVLGSNESSVAIQAVLDTGFNGFLTLPTSVLKTVGASPVGTRRVELGDGHLTELDVYLVTIKWRDESRETLVLHTDATPKPHRSLACRCCAGVESASTQETAARSQLAKSPSGRR